MASERPHTGRRRNEAAREAILDAAVDLLGRSGPAVTIGMIAEAAGVGKQTIYRWWPSKGAVLLEAMSRRAADTAPGTDTGTLAGDLTAFLTDTFLGAAEESARAALRAVMAEALRDEPAAEVLAEFTARRRGALREILERGQARGELPRDADLELMIDQAYGLLWYRVLIGHAPLTREVARSLARTLAG
ncbi:TetR/AcrR family transcriptional regulator [Amycolatopsis anabasis]|uniref:TetR/AcrR family transcriptional regulator n=1 Tax=Amycolatopsis anabasis TaxID=1840409 RepID=UPI00131BF3FC|nr:TetR/AcrR family transcriptional regulator [Amycolatopsis anabasis]